MYPRREFQKETTLVEGQGTDIWTRVRFPSGPLDFRVSNPFSTLKIGAYRNIGCISVAIESFDFVKRQSEATYKDIQEWVKEHYGFHVSNLSISQTKERCGIAKVEYKGNPGAEGHYVPKLKPEKEAAIKEAFSFFGLL